MTVALVVLGAAGCSTGDHHDAAAPPTFGLPRPHDYNDFCNGATCAPHGLVPSTLRRTMHLPQVAPGAGCPVSRSRVVSARFGPALGAGPAFPVGLTGGDLQVMPPSRRTQWAGSGWGGNKVLWVIAPGYRGPLLVRGARIDTRGGVGFDVGTTRPYSELDLPPAAGGFSGWREEPSDTRVRAPGCYAYQIDGTDFSRVIVFRAISQLHG